MADMMFSVRSYCKMILHAAKYPYCAINGVLLADDAQSRQSKGKGLYISDVIPLFHDCLQTTRMASLALYLVNDMAVGSGMVIVGYYLANENIKDKSYGKYHPIADNIAQNFSSAVVVVVDNSRLPLTMDNDNLRVLQKNHGDWKEKDRSGFCLESGSRDAAAILLQKRAYQDLVDFENHSNDFSLDWLNPHFNEMVQRALN